MKKTLMSTLLLAGIVGGMATTAHADDTATADTTMTASIESGGITIETDDAIDFGTIPIGGSSETKYQSVGVTNLTGGHVNTTVKLNEELNDGITLAGDKGPNIGTSPIDIKLIHSAPPVGPVDPENNPPEVVSNYHLDWTLSASNSAQLDSNLSGTIIFTAAPSI